MVIDQTDPNLSLTLFVNGMAQNLRWRMVTSESPSPIGLEVDALIHMARR
jgi:hypothetical protein